MTMSNEPADIADVAIVGLGSGLALNPVRQIGTPAPHPRMSDGRLLDDHVGYEYALIACKVDATADEAMRRQCQQKGVAYVAVDDADPLQAWLDQAGISTALVRPDRYVLAVVETAADAASPLTHALRLQPSLDRETGAA